MIKAKKRIDALEYFSYGFGQKMQNYNDEKRMNK